MTLQQYYDQARQLGYRASHAFHAARTLVQWEAQDEDTVRIVAEPDDEPYDAGDDGEAYTNIHGKRVSAAQARKEIEEMIERDGVWIVCSQIWDGREWETVDSVCGCVGYRNPTDWRQNCYVVDLMASALAKLSARATDEDCVLVNN